MSDYEAIKFAHEGIGKTLSQNRLAVPVNQREYAWEEEHVKELFSDLSDAITKGAYFLGTIVLTRGAWDIPGDSVSQPKPMPKMYLDSNGKPYEGDVMHDDLHDSETERRHRQ